MGLRKRPVICPDLGSGVLFCCFPLSLNAISFVALFRCVSTSYCSGDTTRVGCPRFISLYSAQALISSAPNCFLMRSSNSQACFRLRNSMFLVGENQWQRLLSPSPPVATSNLHPVPGGGFLSDFEELASIEVLSLVFIVVAPIFVIALCPMALVTRFVLCLGLESRLYLIFLVVVFFNSAKALSSSLSHSTLRCSKSCACCHSRNAISLDGGTQYKRFCLQPSESISDVHPGQRGSPDFPSCTSAVLAITLSLSISSLSILS